MTNDIFIPESKNIKSIFGDAESFYRMPEYQRPYSWDDERVEKLWEDIYTSYQNYEESKIMFDKSGNNEDLIDENYFLGSIILIPKDGFYDVVDGQQRLTTLLILFCVIRDLYPDFNKDANSREEVTIDDIKDYIKQKEKFDRLKLHTHIEHQNEFEQEIINGIKWPAKFTKEDKNNKKYMNTALIFKRQLEDIQNNETRIHFVNYLFNKVKLIKIACTSQAFAIKLFQVLNTRGMDLAPADLIKSFLYGQISDESHKQQFIQEWRSIEAMLKNVDSNITDLFNTYLYYLKSANPKRTLYEELVPLFQGKNSNQIIHNFKKFIQVFIEIITSKDYNIYMLKYINHQIYWKAILTTAKFENVEFYKLLANEITIFFYLYWIGGYTSAKIKQTSFNLIKWVKGEIVFEDSEGNPEFSKFIKGRNDIDLINNIVHKSKDYALLKFELRNQNTQKLHFEAICFKLKEKLRIDNVEKRAIINIKENVYDEAWLKPVLLWIEYGLNEEKDFIDRDRDLHAEHIMPQSRKFSYWGSQFSDEEYKSLLNKIENMTLLSGRRNIEASDLPYNSESNLNSTEELIKLWSEEFNAHLDKLFIYKGKGIDGAAKFEITKYIFDNYKDWNITNMAKRREWIYKELHKHFGIYIN